MSLIDAFTESYVMMRKTKTPDGEGGYSVTWTEGTTINAAVTMQSSSQAVIAQSHGVTSVYTVTVARSVNLKYHDVIKRVSDGKVFRITSNGGESRTPSTSALDMMQVTAEGWDLT